MGAGAVEFVLDVTLFEVDAGAVPLWFWVASVLLAAVAGAAEKGREQAHYVRRSVWQLFWQGALPTSILLGGHCRLRYRELLERHRFVCGLQLWSFWRR